MVLLRVRIKNAYDDLFVCKKVRKRKLITFPRNFCFLSILFITEITGASWGAEFKDILAAVAGSIVTLVRLAKSKVRVMVSFAQSDFALNEFIYNFSS